MPMEFLLTRLLRDKQRRDADIARQDELLARDDAFRAQQRQDRLDIEAYRRKQDQAAAERQRRIDSQQAAMRALSFDTDPNFRTFGPDQIGLMTQLSMQNGNTNPVRDIGGALVQAVSPAQRMRAEQTRTQLEEAANQRAFEQETRNMVNRANAVTSGINVPEGRVLNSVNSNTGTVSFGNPPRPAAPRVVPQSEVNRRRDDAAFNAVSSYEQIVGPTGAGVGDLAGASTERLLSLAQTIARTNPSAGANPRDIFEFLLKRKAEAASAARRQSSGVPQVVSSATLGQPVAR